MIRGAGRGHREVPSRFQTDRQESTNSTCGIVSNSQVEMKVVLFLLALKIDSRVCLCQISLMVAV